MFGFCPGLSFPLEYPDNFIAMFPLQFRASQTVSLGRIWNEFSSRIQFGFSERLS